MFIAALFTICKTWKQCKCPSTDEWVKTWCACAMEYYSAMKKANRIRPLAATRSDLKTATRHLIAAAPPFVQGSKSKTYYM